MPTNKRNVLYIRCSDGRSRRPEEIREHCVHQIRLPGGVLNPIYCSGHFGSDIPQSVWHAKLVFDIDTMVELKAPDEIIVASHSHCGAAQAIGFTDQQVSEAHLEWGKFLAERYPNILVRVLHEIHSECGEHHDGYIDLKAA